MVFTMVGLLPQSVRADEAAGDEGVSTYALSEHTVQGLSPNGTTVNLFDYWIDGQDAPDNKNPNNYQNRGINNGHTLKFGAGMGQSGDPYVANSGNVNQWTISAQPRTGIVKNTLGADGYPVLSDTLGGTSLSYLFNSEAQNGKAVYTNVDGLLQVDNDGYFYYNSQSNFAQFNEGTNGFTLYDEGGVTAAGSSPFGQFFPFNTGDQVFVETGGQLDGHGIKSDDSRINHYFGMTMSTRFVQQYGGHTAESGPYRKEVTYNFSGDDDVWVYVDDVLVGDLGGIHDATALEINFSTGTVYVYDDVNGNNAYDRGEEVYNGGGRGQTLKQIFQAAVRGTSGFSGDTFADDTFHTLDFFYLERGNTDSNMSLKYNLVYIPESDIVKVDQASEPIAGVEFELYATGSDYVVSDGAESTYVGYTDAQGIMRIANKDGYTVSLSEMKNVSDYWVLRETTTPSGYRSIEDVPLFFESKITTHSILLSAEPWDTGAYAQPKLTSTTTQNGIYSVNGDRLDNNGSLSGRMFAVVMQKGDDGEWHPITGDALEGWHVSSTSGLAGAVETAQNGDADRFIRNSNGLYQVDITDMPGDIKTYKWIIDNNHTGVEAEYTVQYFYTSANQVSQATVGNTVQVRTDTNQDLVRQFSMQLYVSNIENRFIVRKVDDTGAAVNGATFALYNRNDVAVDQDGNWTALPDVDPIAEVTTATIDLLGGATGQTYELDGAAVIGKSYNGTKLVNGEYYLLETSSPNNAVVNKKAIEIVVDDTGVYANAGTNDDGVLVARGLGRVIGSMQQFTVDDNVDATLHDVKAAIVTSDEYSGDSTNWPEPNWDRTETDGDQFATAMHLQYSDPGDNLPGVVFDYAPIKAGGLTALTTEVGWSKLIVRQCLDHDDSTVSNKTGLGTKDISHLFSGTLVIQVTNVPMGDFELSKTVDPATVADSFTFDLEFEQKLPVNNEETGEVALSAATANYIKTLFPGDYEYTITKTDQSAPIEQGTLTIGEATASGENPGGDTSGEGSTEASAKYIITNVELSSGAGSAYFVASETAGYQVKLAHGETLTINDLPVYTQITATEVKPAGSYLTTVEATPEVTVTEVTASNVEANVDAESEGNSATDGTETETAADGENTADGTDGDNTDAATVEELALDGEESAVTDGEQTTDAGEDGGVDVSNETVAPQVLATSVYTATTIIEKQVTGEGADAPVSYNASIAFTNTQSANATINVQKTLVGTDWTTDKGAYQFTITPLNGAPEPNPNMITITTNSPDSFEEGSETEPTEPTSATVRVGSFGEIAFTGVKVGDSFEYEIKETRPIGTGNGWTYDGHTVKVTVEFEQDETTRELKAVVTYDDNGDGNVDDDPSNKVQAAAFTNTYSATTTYTGLEIVKEMSGRDLVDNEFSFSIVPAEGNPSHDGIDALFADSGALSTLVSFGTDHNADRATISAFKDIKFTQDDDEKEFLFTVSEFIPEENDRELGVTYDRSQYEVKIKVVDNDDGTMHTVTTVTKTADADGKVIAVADRQPVVYGSDNSGGENPQTPSMTFANSYETQPTPSDGVGDGTFTKSFTGRAWTEADSFAFIFSKASYQANAESEAETSGSNFTAMPMPEQTLVEVTSGDLNESSTTDASFGFGKITFSKPGVYTYKVSEQKVDGNGISYSDNVATVTFTVTDDLTGQYKVECEIVYSDSSENETFQNVYTPTGNLPGSTNLEVEKTFTGRPNNAWLASDKFSFVLKPDMGHEATSAAVNAGQIVIENAGDNGATMITIDGDDTVKAASFGDITFTQPGNHTYQFVVYEVQPTSDGTVTGAPNEGVIENDQGQFVLNGITYDNTVKTVKVVVNDNGKGELTATLSEDSGELSFVNTYSTNTVGIKPVDAGLSGIKNLSGRTWENGDSFTFTLTPGECSNPDNTAMDQDDVIATMPKTQKVTITPAVDDSATAEFSFGGDGTETFTFSKPGTYRYLIREYNPYVEEGGSGIIGVNYDETTYRLTVVVEDDGMGNLSIKGHQLSKRAAGSTDGFVDLTEGEGIIFNNEYDASTAVANINAAKVLTGRPTAMTENEFVFRIADAGWKLNDSADEWTLDNSNPMPVAENGVEDDEAGAIIRGDIHFDPISFTADHVGKTFRYAITEVQPTDDGTMDGTPLSGAVKNDAGRWVYKGVTYDNAVKYVTVEVTSTQIEDTENPGHYIEAVFAVTSGEATWNDKTNAFVGGAIFTNTYVSTGTLSGATDLAVEKTFTGRENDEWTENDTFTFTLTGSDGAPMPEGSNGNVKTITVGADDVTNGVHTNHFGDIAYTTADNGKTYIYTIKETAGNVYGVTYSKATYTVTVEVTDKGDGTLDISKTITQIADDDGASDGVAQNPTVAAFANTYDVPEDTKKVETDVAGVMADVNGQLVGVGDVLTYTIHWVNDAIDAQGVAVPAEITVTDNIPEGTEYVGGSAEKTGGVYSEESRSITWKLGEQSAAAQGDVSFQVSVTDDAVKYDSISNIATIEVGNDSKQTNEVTVDVPEKTATDTTADDGLQVGDRIEYSIEWANKTGEDTTVTIRDELPQGVTYNNDASNNGQYNEVSRTLEWQFSAKAGESGTVTFSATVNEDAVVVSDPVKNTASVKVGNDTYTTNTTTGDKPETGDLVVSKKVVSEGGAEIDANDVFRFNITLTDKNDAPLGRSYTARIYNADGTQSGSDFYLSGTAGEWVTTTFTLKHGQSLKVFDLPEGAKYTVTEVLDPQNDAGYEQTAPVDEKDAAVPAEGSISVGTTGAVVAFENTYTPAEVGFDPSGEHGVQVEKQVKGVGEDLSPEGYSFVMNVVNKETGDATGIKSGASQTATSDQDGKVVFSGQVVFTQVGTYTVSVAEKVPSADEEGYDPDVTYDRHTLTYTVNVTDDKNGHLVAKVDDESIYEGENVFTNTHFAEEEAKHVYNGNGVEIDGELVGVGETLTYKINWVNTAVDPDTGAPAAGKVEIVDTLPKFVTPVEGTYGNGVYDKNEGTITWHIDAAAAESGTVSFNATVDMEAAGNELENTASVNGVATNTVSNPVPGKTVTPETGDVDEGTVLTYEVSFVNTDGDGASAVVVDTMTEGQIYNSGTATVKVNGTPYDGLVEPVVEGDAASGQTLTWNLENLAADAQVVVTFKATVTRDAGMAVDNTATVNDHATNTTTKPYPSDSAKDVFFANEPTASIDGKLVGVGDELRYTIDWAVDEAGTLTVTDRVPAGTEYVVGSADATGGVYDSKTNEITWELGEKEAGDRGVVEFCVTVTDDAVNYNAIDNFAEIQIGSNRPDQTNTVHNYIPKKEVVDTSSDTGYQVGDVLNYTIEWANTTGQSAVVTVADTLPVGLTYLGVEEGAVEPEPSVDEQGRSVLTWELGEQADGASGTVTFQARVNEQATVVDDPLTNTAVVTVDNNSYNTNTTEGELGTGDLAVSKTIELEENQGTLVDAEKEFSFELSLKDAGDNPLTMGYDYLLTWTETGEPVLGEDGVQLGGTVSDGSSIVLRHGQTAAVTGLPEGATFTVTEKTVGDGYTQVAPADEDGAAIAATGEIVVDSTQGAAFANSYSVMPDALSFSGTKTLMGRDWTDADSFAFKLAAADEGTQAAIDNGAIVMPNEITQYVKGDYAAGEKVTFGFGDITFNQVGDYSFTISEVVSGATGSEPFVLNGVTYDTHMFTVSVDVRDDGNGHLVAAVDDAATIGDADWINSYAPVFDPETTVNLNGTKVLEGSTLTAGQFYFKVTPLDGAPMGDTWEFGNTNGLGANGALENVGDIELLRNITYTVADMGDATEKTFRYVVTEEIPSEGDRMPGLAYDGSAYLASVTVTDDLAGNLVASAPSIERGVWDGTTFTADEDQSGVEGVVFTNGYTVDGTTAAPVQVTKVLAGNRTAPLAAGEFAFELGIVSAEPADGLTLPEETVVSNAADGTVSFGDVSFSKPGTYVLSVTEVVPEGAEQNGDGSYTLDGVTYDTHTVTMTYTVVDQNAQLVATLGAVEGDTTFTNTYNATETLDGAANLTVTKAVEGDFTWKEGTSFTFALTGADIATQEAIANGTVVLPDNADGIAIAYNAADPDAPHTASFGDITFKAAGDYLFAITEQQGDIAGMTYDVEQHLVSVAVTDNGDGTLAVVPDADTVNPTVTNAYEPTEAVLSGAGNLTVTKNLVGRDWQEGDSFTFMLEADMDDATTAAAMNDGAIRLPGNAGGITVAFDANDPEAAHSASFGDIAFTRAGTYRFTVTELAGSIDGVVYDTAAHEVVVTVVDNGDGTLGFAADGVVGANPTITNVFTAPIDYSARSEIVISKRLDGRPAAAGQFSFTVTPADEASALKLGIPEDGYTLSTPAAGDGEKATVNLFATLLGEGKPPVTFTRDDAGTTFSYTVTENGTAPDGYTYDASVYTVDIAVTDDPSAGGLTVTTQVSDGASYTMMTTVTNATEFAQPVEIPFVNSYRASTDVEGGTAAVVNGTKELVGTAMREFSFALEGVAGTNTEGYTNTAVNGEDGSFSFALDYDQDSFTAGATADENGNRSETFVYTLREVGGGDVTGGITYDDARYRVTVTVTDNGDGTMVASVTKLEQRFVDEAGVESWISADAAAFTNTYAAATSVSLDVDKVLSGRDMTAADSYEFVAYAYDRATQAIDRTSLVATGSTPAGQTAADGAAVPVDMSDIEYTIEKLNADTATPWVDVADEAGQPTGARTKTYDYAIEEVVGSDLNISYAPEVFYAQVVVTDDGQGNLTATKAYFADAAMQQPMVGEDGSSTVPTFVNTYLPDATSFHLTGTKTTTFVNVDPGTEPELRFMYDIYLEENGASELVASGWSYANGTVSADIPVTGEGSFTYRIVERYAGTTSGTVTYDDAVYYLTLEVARNADTGIYDFAPTYYRVEDDGTWTQIDAAGLTFANTYDGAAGTTVSLGATKMLEGATFEQLGQLNDKFGFSLYEGDDATGTYLGEGTITGVDANGNGIVTFPNLSYTFYLQDQPAAETPGEGTEAGQPDGFEEGTEGEAPEGGQTGTGETGTGENGTAVPSDPNAGQPSGEGGATEPDQPAEPSGDAGATEPVEPVTPVEPDQPAADVPAETPSVDETPAVEGTPEAAPEAPAEDASGDAGVQTASIADLFVASEAIADDADAEPFTVDIVDAGAEVAEPVATVAEQADGQTGTSGETAPAAPAEPVIVSDDLGTHVYTIVENVPAGSTQNEDGTWTAPNGVTYDGTKYRVTVEVAASYDAATQKATMTATVTGIARSDSHGSFEDGHATPVDPTNPAASIVFTNSYAAKQPVEVSFAGTKNLTGRDMAEGEFSFAVLEGETPVATATNAADGTVSFSFGVTTPGTHTYTVVEADGGKGGVSYDTAPRTVTVEVGVNPDGTLAVESVALPEGGLVFNNTYTASGSTEAVIEGTKALTGRTMAEGEFRFVVVETVDGVENIVAAGENQAPGEDGVAAITFAPIAYDAEDLGKTFTYQVRELDLGAGGVTYDTAAFTVQVAVVDDLDGTISTEVTYLDGPVAFENSYGTVDGAKVEVTPEVTKTLTGRDMVDGEFVFTVTDAATGNVAATGANTADGKVVWDAPITLTAKGDYEFVIAEVNGRQDGVTYDDATYRLLVTVADDGEGGLTVESLDYPDGAPAFSNSYEEPEKPADPDKPSIPGGPTESVPQTGDDTNLAAAAALGLGGLGAALLGGGALLRRRASR